MSALVRRSDRILVHRPTRTRGRAKWVWIEATKQNMTVIPAEDMTLNSVTRKKKIHVSQSEKFRVKVLLLLLFFNS